MTTHRTSLISGRKLPKQGRSNELVRAILDAAVQVLATEGAQRFTTARVAERAGVSVGSLYQYFPNKAAILFRLQRDEWRETTSLLNDILRDTTRHPFERLRTLVRAFVQSECDEATVRGALSDAAPLYRDAPEAQDAMAGADLATTAFMREALPDVSDDVRELASSVIFRTLWSVGKSFSETPRAPADIENYSDAMAAMFCAYLQSLQPAPSELERGGSGESDHDRGAT